MEAILHHFELARAEKNYMYFDLVHIFFKIEKKYWVWVCKTMREREREREREKEKERERVPCEHGRCLCLGVAG